MKMKSTNISENLARYQQLTDKYKIKNRSKHKNSCVSLLEVPYTCRRSQSMSRGRVSTSDVRAYESDNEVNYKCEDYLVEPNARCDKSLRMAHAQEGRSRSRGRLQLRLKKVKEYETDIAVETFSELRVRTRRNWTSYDSDSSTTGRNDKYHYLQRFSKTDNNDLVCIYNVTDSEIDSRNHGQNILLVKKYQTLKKSEEAVFERLVRPSHRLKTRSRQREDKSSGTCRSNKTVCESTRFEEHNDEKELYKSRKGANRCMGILKSELISRPSKWNKTKDYQNMSVSESESEFEVEEKQDLCKTFKRIRSRHSRSIIQNSSTSRVISEVGLKERIESEATEETDDESDSVRKHSESDLQMFECEFCTKLFSSEESLDNHYMTHFTTVQGLNTFLNERHQQKYLGASSSILKHSGRNCAGVKKKVAFEIDMDEGIDCRSPRSNRCEIIDLVSYEKNIDENVRGGKDNVNEVTEIPKKKVVKQEEVSETSSKLEIEVSISDEPDASADRIKADRILINVDSENLYCSHNVELAKSCVNRFMKVTLSPLKKGYYKLDQKGRGKESRCKKVDNSVKELWSIAKNSVKGRGNNSRDSENNRKRKNAVKKGGIDSLKMTLSKQVDTLKEGKEVVKKETEEVRNGENNTGKQCKKGNKSKLRGKSRNKKNVLKGNHFRKAKKLQRSSKKLSYIDEKLRVKTGCVSVETGQNEMKAVKDSILDINVGKKKVRKCKKSKTRKRDKDLSVDKEQDNEVFKKKATRSKHWKNPLSMIGAADSNTCNKRKMNVPASECISKRVCREPNLDSKRLKLKGCLDEALVCMSHIQNMTFQNVSSLGESEKQNYDREKKSMNLRMKPKEKDTVLYTDSSINSDQISNSKISCLSGKVCGIELKPMNEKSEKEEGKSAGFKKERNRQKELCQIVSISSTDTEKSNDNLNVSVDPKAYEKSKKNENYKIFGKKAKRRPISKEFVYSSEDSGTEDKPTDENDLIWLSNDLLNSEKELTEKATEREHPPKRIDRRFEVQGNLEKMQAYIVSKKDYFEKMDIENEAKKKCHHSADIFDIKLNEKSVSMEKEQLNKTREKRIYDAFKLGTQNGSSCFIRNDPFLCRPEYDSDDDEKIYDCCCDDVLIEFASDLDIVLNSPDNAALMFDENTLYKNLENLTAKDLLIGEDTTETSNTCTDVTVENTGNISAQMLVDVKEPEDYHNSLLYNHSKDSMKRSSPADNEMKEESYDILRSGMGLPVSPDAISVCMAITSLPQEEENQENENSIFQPHVEINDTFDSETKFTQRVQDKKLKAGAYSRDNKNFEADTLSKFDDSGDVEIQSRFIKSSRKEITQDRELEELSQCVKPEVERDCKTSPNYTGKVKGSFLRVGVSSYAGCQEEVMEVQCTKRNEKKDGIYNGKMEITGKSRLNNEYDKEDTDNLKLETDDQSGYNMSVQVEKKSIGGEKIYKGTDEKLSEKLKDTPKETENDIQKSSKNEFLKKQGVEDIYKQMKKLHVFNKKRRRCLSLSRKYSVETNKNTKIETSQDMNNNCLVEVIDITKSDDESTNLQNSDEAALGKHAEKTKTCNKCPELNNDQVEIKKSDIPFNRLYRCDKCNMLFHAVSPLNLNVCKKCDGIVFENKSSCQSSKHLKDPMPNDRINCSNEKGKGKLKADNEMDTDKPGSGISEINVKHAPDNKITGKKENLKEKIIGSPGPAGEYKGLKLVFQKVKMPTVGSDEDKYRYTCSTEQPRWKVIDSITSDTQLTHALENSNEGNGTKRNTGEVKDFDDINMPSAQISESVNTEIASNQNKEGHVQSFKLMKEEVRGNMAKSSRILKVDDCENETNMKIKDENSENQIKIRKSARNETKGRKVAHMETRSDCQKELNEFEKALLKDSVTKKKHKVKKMDEMKNKRKTISSQILDEKIKVEDNKILLFKRKNIRDFTNSKSVQPFQKSKMAQMIYSKHQRENWNYFYGLPDFTTVKAELPVGGLQPLSVSTRSLTSSKSSYKDSDSCSKISDDNSYSGVSAISEMCHPVTTAAPDLNNVSATCNFGTDVDTTVTYSQNKNTGFSSALACKEYAVSTADYSHLAAATSLKSYMSVNGFQKVKTDIVNPVVETLKVGESKKKNERNFKELKKELEAIGITKDVKLKGVGSFMCESTFSSPWNGQKKETITNNSQSVLPSFSDTFSKKRLSPSVRSQTFSCFTNINNVSESSESCKTYETDSSLNGDDECFITELAENKLDKVGKSPEHCAVSVFDRLGKRKMSGGESAVLLLQEPLESQAGVYQHSPTASPIRSEFIATRLDRNVMNFSSTPAIKRASCNSTVPVSEMNISQISMSSSVAEETSGFGRPKRRRIKRLDMQEHQSDAADLQRSPNILQDSQVSSMLILSADCSKMDMTGLSGPSVDTSIDHRLYNNLGYKDTIFREQHETHNFQTFKTEDDMSDRKQIQTIETLKRIDTYTSVNLPECMSVERESGTQDETILDYEDDHFSLFGVDTCDGTALDDNPKDFSTFDESDGTLENVSSDQSLRSTQGNKEGKTMDEDLHSGDKVNIDVSVRREEETFKLNEGSLRSFTDENMLLCETDDLETNKCNQRVFRNQIEDKIACDSEIGGALSAFSRNREVESSLDSIVEMEIDEEQDGEINICSKSVQKDKKSKSNNTDEEYAIDKDTEIEDKKGNTGTNTEDGDQSIKKTLDESQREDEDEDGVMDDVLELYASDEEAFFLLDSPAPCPPTQSQNKANASQDRKRNNEVVEMELETGSFTSESPVLKTNSPVTTGTSKLQQNLSVFRPLRSNPIKGRWMPRGWCFRYFTRNGCSPQCVFRHDEPTEVVLSRCIADITEKCRKGELDSAMNMLMSQQYFMDNISQDDLDCLYGYSVNNLRMEYCQSLLQLISSRDLIKQGHIDDIIFLWKRLIYSNDIEALKDAFFMAKQKKIFPQPTAALILLEGFTVYGDMYMLWDLIIYCTQNKNLVISQQFIHRAVSLVACCQDTSLLSAAVTWLEAVTCEQLVQINNEVLHRMKNTLQQMNLVKLLSSIQQCLLRKKQIPSGAGQQSVPKISSKSLSQTANYVTSSCDPLAFERQTVSPQFSSQSCSRATTPSNPDFTDAGQYKGQNGVPLAVTAQTQPMTESVTYVDSDIVRRAGNQNFPQCFNAKLVSRADNDSTDFGRGTGQQNVAKLFTPWLRLRTANTPKPDKAGQVIWNENLNLSQPGHAQSRALTQTDSNVAHLVTLTSNELSLNDFKLMEQIEAASERSNWQSLADLFLYSCQSGPPPPKVFQQVLFALTKDDSSVGKAWGDFISYIKQKQAESPGLRLNKYSLSVLGSEIFYACYQRSSPDAKDVLLVVLDTDFLTLIPSVGQRWKVCLELLAAEFLSVMGMPEKAADILLEMSSKQRLETGVKSSLLSFLQPLTLQLCAEGKNSLAFKIFCMAFRWKYKGLGRIASELIQSCLQVEIVDIPVQIYELFLTDSRQFDIWETVKRSLLNALVDVNREYSKRLYREIIQNKSSSSYLQQSFKKPRCIWLQSSHTYNETKLIIEEYLQDLCNVFYDQIANSFPLTVQDLSLDVAVDRQMSPTNQVKMPYVGLANASLSSIKHLLSTEFGIESELSRKGILKLSVQQASLEKYLNALDQQGGKLGLYFG